ncbi:MAG TPA: hypothetical protein VK669_02560 [Candidatus Limnocylindrales bacterium]|nr:hypothetical protein [Candidatus Limnocylindrales bacterium]
MPISYTVSGPFVLPTVKNQNGTKRIGDNVKQAFAETDYAHRKGCYIFAVSRGHGAIVPHYIGQTKKSFFSECFTDHKLRKYDVALHSDSYGKPMLFFVEAPAAKGPVNSKALTALEDYLIGLGLQRNAKLKNIRGTRNAEPPFAIKDVHTKRRGKPRAEVTAFRRMLGINAKK